MAKSMMHTPFETECAKWDGRDLVLDFAHDWIEPWPEVNDEVVWPYYGDEDWGGPDDWN